MTHDDWWDSHGDDGLSNYTASEAAWKAGQRVTWETVFQVVSDFPGLSREFVRALEGERDRAGYGPVAE